MKSHDPVPRHPLPDEDDEEDEQELEEDEVDDADEIDELDNPDELDEGGEMEELDGTGTPDEQDDPEDEDELGGPGMIIILKIDFSGILAAEVRVTPLLKNSAFTGHCRPLQVCSLNPLQETTKNRRFF